MSSNDPTIVSIETPTPTRQAAHPVAIDDSFENAEKVGLHLAGPDA